MPVACSTSTLTGSSGAIYFTPAATRFCLLADDFDSTGDQIEVGVNNDYRVGDSVKFSVEGTATLDTGVTAGQDYVIESVTGNKIELIGVTIAGDGTDGTGHVVIEFDPAQAICECREFTVNYSREQLDVTTLPCGVSTTAGGQKYASTKRMQPGYAEITGTMTLYITSSDSAISTRLMESIHLNRQDGASAKLYVDAVSDGGVSPLPDDTASRLIAGSVVFTDFSTSVNPDDPTQAEVTFNMFDLTHWIGVALT
tara:strand:+ start:6302 stop:7066 length:765 start_codon:yes stop_codon:yes gene_type:complete